MIKSYGGYGSEAPSTIPGQGGASNMVPPGFVPPPPRADLHSVFWSVFRDTPVQTGVQAYFKGIQYLTTGRTDGPMDIMTGFIAVAVPVVLGTAGLGYGAYRLVKGRRK